MEFISGGYYLVSPIKRSEYMDKDLIPEIIYSASECLCDFHPEINTFGEVQEKGNKNTPSH
jgi:hypothetical protein